MSFFFGQYTKDMSLLLIFSKNQFCLHFLFSIFSECRLFIFTLILIISFLILVLNLVCSSVSSFLWCKIKLLMWDFLFFIIYVFTAINFPVYMVLAASYKFSCEILLFLFSSLSNYSLVFLVISLICYLI